MFIQAFAKCLPTIHSAWFPAPTNLKWMQDVFMLIQVSEFDYQIVSINNNVAGKPVKPIFWNEVPSKQGEPVTSQKGLDN